MDGVSDLVMRIAHESGVVDPDLCGPGLLMTDYGDSTEAIHIFAALVAEECAKECDAQRFNTGVLLSNPGQSCAARDAAKAIRAIFPKVAP